MERSAPLGPVISYAQNFEDVVLARGFAGRRDGFYVDLGAAHPTLDSVTRHFYDLGWRGVNVEPLHEFAALLREQRERDVNLEVGLGAEPGEAVLIEGPADSRGSSTFAPDIAADLARGGASRRITVTMTTLAEVCERYVPSGTVIDFLKIDVEGYEEQVLRGADLERWPPRALVIEATRPQSTEPAHEAWEPLVLAHGYEHTLFDGLNRFYVREGEPELRAALSVPANVLDGFVPYRQRLLEEQFRRCEEYALSLAAELERRPA